MHGVILHSIIQGYWGKKNGCGNQNNSNNNMILREKITLFIILFEMT